MKPRNFVAKHLGVNHSQVFVDRKKETKAGAYKHQAMSELRKAYLEHKRMEELYSLDKYRGYTIAIEFLAEGVYDVTIFNEEDQVLFFPEDTTDPVAMLLEAKNFLDEVLEDD